MPDLLLYDLFEILPIYVGLVGVALEVADLLVALLHQLHGLFDALGQGSRVEFLWFVGSGFGVEDVVWVFVGFLVEVRILTL